MKPSRIRHSVTGLAISLAILSYVQRVAISEAAGPIMHDLHIPIDRMGLVFGAFGLSKISLVYQSLSTCTLQLTAQKINL